MIPHSEVDPEMYSKTKWDSRHKKREDHKKESWKILKKNLQKQQEKRRKKGRNKKKFQPESEELSATELSSIANIINTTDENSKKWQKIVAQQITFIGSLCVANDWKNVTGAIFQMLAGVFDLDDVKMLMNYITIEPEGDDEATKLTSFQKFKAAVINLKTSSSSLAEIPMWKQLTRCFALLTLFGLKPDHIPLEEGIVKMVMAKWMQRIDATTDITSVFDLILDSVIFAIEFYEGFANGDISYLLKPTNLILQGNELLSMEESFDCGQLTIHGKTEAVYEMEVETTITRIQSVIAARKATSIDSMALRVLYVSLNALLSRIRIKGNAGGLRVHPPVVVLYGQSHVGKSAFGHLLIKLVGSWLDFETEDKNIYYPAKGDAFDSGYTSLINSVFMDDMANTKEKYQDDKERNFFIRFANAIKYMSVQAELGRKGRIPIDPKFCLATTNVGHLDITTYSNKPESQYNRFIGVELEVKPEFRGKNPDGTDATFIDPKLMTEELDFSMHRFRYYKMLKRTQPNRGKGSSGKEDYVPWYGEWKDVNPFLLDLRSKILEKQDSGEKYLTAITNMRKSPVCSCGLLQSQCACDIKPEAWMGVDFNSPAGISMLTHIESIPSISDVFFTCWNWMQCIGNLELPNFIGYFLGHFATLFGWLHGKNYAVFVFTTRMLNKMHLGVKHYFSSFVEWCYPYWRKFSYFVLNTAVEFVSNMTFYLLSVPLRALGRSLFLKLWITPVVFAIIIPLFTPNTWYYARLAIFSWLFFTYFCFSVIKDKIRKAVFNVIKNDIDGQFRTLGSLSVLGIGMVSAFVSVCAIRSLYRSYASVAHTEEGNLHPTQPKEVADRAAERNVWVDAVPNVQQYDTTKVDTMTHAHVVSHVANNTVRIEARSKQSGMVIRTNALIYNSGVIILPAHSADKIDLDSSVTMTVHPNRVGGSHRVYLVNPVRMDPDFTVLQYSGGPSFLGLRDFIVPTVCKTKHHSTMVSREVNGEITKRTLSTNPQKVFNGVATGHGSVHQCSVVTRTGDCCSALVRNQVPCYITGLHAGGNGKTSCSFSISREGIEKAIASFPTQFSPESKQVCLPVAHTPPLKMERYGNKMTVSPMFHPRACVNFSRLDEDGRHSRFTPIGTIDAARFTSYSCVKVTPLSVELDKLGRHRVVGPPKILADRNHAATYAEASKPFDDIHPEILDWAAKDWLKDVLDHTTLLHSRAKPLTLTQSVNGVPGSQFLKRMNMKTSMGPFLKKKKIDHFPLIATEPRNVYECPPEVQKEYDRCLVSLRKGELDRPLLQSSLKDEPTKLTKDWVRVFTVSPVYNILVGRTLLLPLMAILYGIPITTGMWQGVSVVNDEWTQVYKKMEEVSTTNCLEGDYSKWDMRVSGQMIRMVAVVMRAFAKHVGYSEEDQVAVQTYLMDCATTSMVFNGVLLAVDGYNPSGTPPTTLINGIGNNLAYRCAWKVLWHKHESGPIQSFRSGVLLGTMGDDSVASVKEEYPWFNMRNVQSVFADIHLPYTDGDKNVGAQCKEFIPLQDLTFCKRQWRFEERINHYAAPLSLSSVYKSLHCHMESKTSVVDIMTQNVDGALRELARHSKEVFELEAGIIRQASIALGIGHLIPNLHLDYDGWWEILRKDFLLDPGPDHLLGSIDNVEVE